MSCFLGVLTRVQSNILVDITGHARITDFGLATITCDLGWIRTASEKHQPIIPWAAPEVLKDEGAYSKEADIFSFAMVMIEVCQGWDVLAGFWFTAALDGHRCSLVLFLSTVAYLQRLCWT